MSKEPVCISPISIGIGEAFSERQAIGTQRLAICLPTYNRSDVLSHSLPQLIAAVSKHRIPIYISDNDSDDATGAVVTALQADYDLLYYSRSEIFLTVDDHFQRALHLPDTRYRWLFGDHYRIASEEGLQRLVASLQENFDVVVVNAQSRVQGVPTQTFVRQDSVLEKLGWHMTLMTSLVYNVSALERMNFDRYRDTNLIQTLSIFEYLNRTDFKLLWLSDIVISDCNVVLKNSWHAQALQIFVRGWFVGIMSLPPGYSYDAKLQALRSHARNVGLFSLQGVIYMRSIGAISYALLKSYRRELPYTLDRKQIIWLWLSLLVPAKAMRVCRQVALYLRSKLRQDL